MQPHQRARPVPRREDQRTPVRRDAPAPRVQPLPGVEGARVAGVEQRVPLGAHAAPARRARARSPPPATARRCGLGELRVANHRRPPMDGSRSLTVACNQPARLLRAAIRASAASRTAAATSAITSGDEVLVARESPRSTAAAAPPRGRPPRRRPGGSASRSRWRRCPAPCSLRQHLRLVLHHQRVEERAHAGRQLVEQRRRHVAQRARAGRSSCAAAVSTMRLADPAPARCAWSAGSCPGPRARG